MLEECSVIIDRLIELRHSRGMTQERLAQATNLTQSVIARLESKKVVPTLDTLLKVTSALNCDVTIAPRTK